VIIVKELMEIWPNEVCDKNRRQEVISRRKLEEPKWCGCPKGKRRKAVCPLREMHSKTVLHEFSMEDNI